MPANLPGNEDRTTVWPREIYRSARRSIASGIAYSDLVEPSKSWTACMILMTTVRRENPDFPLWQTRCHKPHDQADVITG